MAFDLVPFASYASIHMRRILMLGALAGLCGCPRGGAGNKVAKPIKPPVPAPEAQMERPAIRAKIDVTTSEPTAGNARDKRSPVLDILKGENDRQMAALKAAPEPAYFLAYQLVEQRVVSLEAEGGALITD